jgi:hypothetical protein
VLQAFIDDSKDQREEESFALGGFRAPADRWERLNEDWNTLLTAEGLIEFNASDCSGGWGPFRGKTADERNRIYGKFLDVIEALAPHGTATIIDMPGWPVYGDFLRSHGEAQYAKPFVTASMHITELMAKLDSDPSSEQIAFVFDNQEEFAGRVTDLFLRWQAEAKIKPDLAFAARFHSITWADSKQTPGLQAADVLAYEARMRFRPGWTARWQWTRLEKATSRLSTFYLNAAGLQVAGTLMEALSQRYGEAAKNLTREQYVQVLIDLGADSSRVRNSPFAPEAPPSAPPEVLS